MPLLLVLIEATSLIGKPFSKRGAFHSGPSLDERPQPQCQQAASPPASVQKQKASASCSLPSSTTCERLAVARKGGTGSSDNGFKRVPSSVSRTVRACVLETTIASNRKRSARQRRAHGRALTPRPFERSEVSRLGAPGRDHDLVTVHGRQSRGRRLARAVTKCEAAFASATVP
jgi:hypothetical protein